MKPAPIGDLAMKTGLSRRLDKYLPGRSAHFVRSVADPVDLYSIILKQGVVIVRGQLSANKEVRGEPLRPGGSLPNVRGSCKPGIVTVLLYVHTEYGAQYDPTCTSTRYTTLGF